MDNLINKQWVHISTGNIYSVLFLTNENTSDPIKFPITVVYKDNKENIWSRPLKDFLIKFQEKLKACN